MDSKSEKSKPDLIPPHGGYRNLKSYQTAEIVYDATAVFCNRFIDKRSRTHDQMVQAGRSGKQNIAEGSMKAGSQKSFIRHAFRQEENKNGLLTWLPYDSQ